MFGSFVQRCNDLNKKYPAKSGFWKMIEEYQAAPVANTRTVVNRYNPSVPSVRPSAPSAKKEYVLPKSAAYTPWYKDILENATHLLIAGETGSGKSVVLNGILHTALALYAPGEMSFCLIDPKMVELSPYEDLPHTVRYETEPEDVLALLRDVYDFMMKRYEEMGSAGLEDRRGRRAGTLPSRTPEEEMRDRIAELERRNRDLQMENDLLKKVRELEMRDRYL